MTNKARNLSPPDLERCQAEKPNGNTFMTLGGVPGYIRCDTKPEYILVEREPGDDGQRGSMTLCESCYQHFLRQMDPDSVTVRKLGK